jgi:hypothetical protein
MPTLICIYTDIRLEFKHGLRNYNDILACVSLFLYVELKHKTLFYWVDIFESNNAFNALTILYSEFNLDYNDKDPLVVILQMYFSSIVNLYNSFVKKTTRYKAFFNRQTGVAFEDKSHLPLHQEYSTEASTNSNMSDDSSNHSKILRNSEINESVASTASLNSTECITDLWWQQFDTIGKGGADDNDTIVNKRMTPTELNLFIKGLSTYKLPDWESIQKNSGLSQWSIDELQQYYHSNQFKRDQAEFNIQYKE